MQGGAPSCSGDSSRPQLSCFGPTLQLYWCPTGSYRRGVSPSRVWGAGEGWPAGWGQETKKLDLRFSLAWTPFKARGEASANLYL